jgi:N-acetylglucosaminyl-diphospho-decaprenol L-rhamnosyltransferase
LNPTRAASISIVIVSYNTRDHLQRCLTALRQWPSSITQQVIVIDNSSTDRSPEIIEREFPEVLLLRSPTNDGYGVAINTAARHATGAWLLFLNPDVEVTEGSLDALIGFGNSHPRAGVIGPRLLYANGESQASAKHFLSIGLVLAEALRLHLCMPAYLRQRLFLGTYFAQDQTLRAGWVSGACHLIPRRVWEKVGLLTEQTFCGSDDYDYCYRAAQHGYQVWLCAAASMTHHCSVAVRHRWTRWEMEQLAIHNFYVVIESHWPPWRVKAFCAAESVGYLLEMIRNAIRPRFQGDAALHYRDRLRQRLHLTLRLLTGRETPLRRFQAARANEQGQLTSARL